MNEVDVVARKGCVELQASAYTYLVSVSVTVVVLL